MSEEVTCKWVFGGWVIFQARYCKEIPATEHSTQRRMFRKKWESQSWWTIEYPGMYKLALGHTEIEHISGENQWLEFGACIWCFSSDLSGVLGRSGLCSSRVHLRIFFMIFVGISPWKTRLLWTLFSKWYWLLCFHVDLCWTHFRRILIDFISARFPYPDIWLGSLVHHLSSNADHFGSFSATIQLDNLQTTGVYFNQFSSVDHVHSPPCFCL